MDASRFAVLCGFVSALALGLAAPARADGDEPVSGPAPVADERKFTYSLNLDGTSDYVFRGVSQTMNKPTIQGGADVSYGIIYAGTWASGLDFGDDPTVSGSDAQVEIDWYGGIRPTWQSPLGLMNLDFGAIYYTYPGANDFAGNLDYVELKAGYSWSVLHPSLTTGTTVYWSPDYFASTGSVWTVESFAAWTLPKVHIFSPVINGLVGWQTGNAKDGYFWNVNGTDNSYYYWNAGLVASVDNISFDFRYWDTNVGGDAGGPFCGTADLCDQRFVFTAKVVVP